jgi:hypothetical protein
VLDREATKILSAIVFVMLASAIWQVAHAATLSAAPLYLPAAVLAAWAICALRERRLSGSLEAIAAWKRWGALLMIPFAAICAALGLLPVIHSIGIALPPSQVLTRWALACMGLVIVLAGNLKPKLPPLEMKRRTGFFPHSEGEATVLRSEGRFAVFFGLVVIVAAFALPVSLFGPLNLLLALAVLIVIAATRHGLRRQT